ncbi:hypothetical protein SAMN02910358_01704 [Lachnospiraceae bacterium XBB1006]|nr:hypothetical protein SAMN02910358_01704 [Lachnospiraceae bacterium XBB1006]
MKQEENINMTISSVMKQKGEKVVYVRFERMQGGKRHFAEGIVPNCTFEKVYGFTEEEVAQLKFYLKENVHTIFEEAQKINDKEFWLK